jgi:hypothetical protein
MGCWFRLEAEMAEAMSMFGGRLGGGYAYIVVHFSKPRTKVSRKNEVLILILRVWNKSLVRFIESSTMGSTAFHSGENRANILFLACWQNGTCWRPAPQPRFETTVFYIRLFCSRSLEAPAARSRQIPASAALETLWRLDDWPLQV